MARGRELKLFYIKWHAPEDAALNVEMTAYNSRRPNKPPRGGYDASDDQAKPQKNQRYCR